MKNESFKDLWFETPKAFCRYMGWCFVFVTLFLRLHNNEHAGTTTIFIILVCLIYGHSSNK